MFHWFKFGVFWVLVIAFVACDSQEKIAGSPSTGDADQVLPELVDFNFHIKPILSDRCFKCHGPDANSREAGLAFHERDMAFGALGANKDRFAIIAGDIKRSTLITRITTQNPDEVMPPPASNLSLTQHEIDLLTKWVEQGAEWKKHWALIPPKQVDVSPPSKYSEWTRNEIDHFVASKLTERGMSPSEAAPKEKLLRRVSFDLTGLPPTIAQLDEFLQDSSKNAFEHAIDRLLSSSSYGEKMALEWMDLARYADTHGYQDDFERLMWPWRDWVIHAFNQNMSYKQFVTWQLAGDLFPDPTLEQIIATGFNRNHKITAEGGVIPEEYRTEYVADRAETFSKAFLGVTMECARCHDHKYDPLTQKEYFSLFGFFNNVPENGMIMDLSNRDKPLIAEPSITLTDREIRDIVQFINNKDSLEEIKLMVMQEMPRPRDTYLLGRGQYDQPLEKVEPAAPSSIMGFDEVEKNRLGLSKWLFDERNPLTARVAVNRLWKQMFGKGIVATAADFGNQGALPTHPELLDFLAIRLIESDWDMKAMLKYMALSATYQQSTNAHPENRSLDPDNRWLARASSIRLKGEMIRDQALYVSGLLSDEIGGPSVKPYQPKGIWEETTGGGGGSTAKYVQGKGEDLYRKSLYTFWKRTVPPPSMLTFDAPSRDICTIDRQKTNTPLQALVLMNDPQIIEAGRLLAVRAIEESGPLPEDKINFMFRVTTSRVPKTEEIQILKEYFQEEQDRFKAHPEEAVSFLEIGDTLLQLSSNDSSEVAAYAMVANTLLNLDETISRG